MVNNWKEILETNEDNKKSNWFNYKEIINDFIENKTKWDLLYFQSNNKYTNIWDDFLSYLKYSSNLDVKTIKELEDWKDLKYLVELKKLSITQNIDNIAIFSKTLKSFELDYNLTLNKFDLLKEKLNKSSIKNLKYLINSQVDRQKFLLKEKIFNLDEINANLKTNTEKLELIFQNNQELINQAQNNQELTHSILRLLNMNSKIDLEDLDSILNALSAEWKKYLLSYFIPHISIKDVKDIWLIDEEEIKKYVKLVIEHAKIDLELLDEIYENIDISKIHINSYDLINKTNFIWLLNSKNKQIILDEINKTKDVLAWNEIINYDDFIKNVKQHKELPSEIKSNIEKLALWNYIEIKSQKKDFTTVYFKVWEINDLSNQANIDLWFKLYNVTRITWVAKNEENCYSEFKNFNSMIDFLVSISKANFTLNFLTKQDLETNKINEVEEQEIETKEQLAIFLNEYDEKWKDVPLEKTAFTYKDWEEEIDLSITSIAWNEIVLNSGERLSFNAFAQAFKEKEPKRYLRVDNLKELIDSLKQNNKEFKDIEVDKNKIVPKSKKWDEDFNWIEYFVWEKWEAIYIDEIYDWEITFITWEYKESKDWNTFKWKEKATKWSYNSFYSYIRDKKLTPKYDMEIKDEIETINKVPRKRHFFTEFMWMMSIAEMTKWFSSITDTIKHHLETWNQLKSAQFAMKLGRFLPQDIRDELQSTLESKEKKTMQELKDSLQWLDSGLMVAKVERILLSKSSHQYEIEAAMFATIKYWGLYPKSLQKYRWRYLWFFALWWNEADIKKMTKELKENDPDVMITEELLIWVLLKKQAWTTWHNWIKRRSKIYKEFWRDLKAWVEKEMWDWEAESWTKMTQKWRLDYIMWEFKWWTYANGIWAIEKLWWKWPDPAYIMNAPTFIILTSGISENFSQILINKLVNYWYSTSHVSFLYCKSKQLIKEYNEYVENVIKTKFKDNSKMLEDFLAIKKSSNDKKVEKSYNFWMKYWADLYPTLNMNDWYVVANKNIPWNEALNSYFEKIKWYVNSDDFQPNSDDIEGWVYDQENSWLAQVWAFVNKIESNDRWYINKKTKKILKMHTDYLKNTMKSSDLTVEQKKEIFFDFYKTIERKVYSKIAPYRWNNTNNWKWFKDYEIVKALNDNWVNIFDWDDNYELFLEEKWNELVLNNFSLNKTKNDNLEDVKNKFQKWIESILDEID